MSVLIPAAAPAPEVEKKAAPAPEIEHINVCSGVAESVLSVDESGSGGLGAESDQTPEELRMNVAESVPDDYIEPVVGELARGEIKVILAHFPAAPAKVNIIKQSEKLYDGTVYRAVIGGQLRLIWDGGGDVLGLKLLTWMNVTRTIVNKLQTHFDQGTGSWQNFILTGLIFQNFAT